MNEFLKVKSGIVLMLDALGTKNYNIQESILFVDKWDTLMTDIETFTDSFFKIGEIEIKHRKPKPLVFGDTILLVWNIDDYDYDMPGAFYDASIYAAHIIKKGIENKVYLRGAITAGEYIGIDKNHIRTYVGPAISDAASWHEEADWLGIIATPLCTFKLEGFFRALTEIETINNSSLSGLDPYLNKGEEGTCADALEPFVIYDVPLKNNKKLSLYTINWPALVSGESKSHSEWLNSHFAQSYIPKGTESKYLNTSKYFHEVARS